MKLIDKAAVVAEIEKRKKIVEKRLYINNFYNDEGNEMWKRDKALYDTYNSLLQSFDTIKVKEVDLEKEIKEEYSKRRCYGGKDNMLVIINEPQFNTIAKLFFEYGLSANNPITAADRGMAEEIIINLKRVEQDYHINLTKEMEWLRNKVKKGE